jgi:hypothetical protein
LLWRLLARFNTGRSFSWKAIDTWGAPVCVRIGRTSRFTKSDFTCDRRIAAAFAFGTLGAQALFAGHHPANLASRHVLTKLGFQFSHEGFYRPTGLKHLS